MSLEGERKGAMTMGERGRLSLCVCGCVSV